MASQLWPDHALGVGLVLQPRVWVGFGLIFSVSLFRVSVMRDEKAHLAGCPQTRGSHVAVSRAALACRRLSMTEDHAGQQAAVKNWQWARNSAEQSGPRKLPHPNHPPLESGKRASPSLTACLSAPWQSPQAAPVGTSTPPQFTAAT